MKAILWLGISGLLFQTLGCGSDSSDDTTSDLPSTSVGGNPFKVFEKETLEEKEDTITGTATILNPDPSVSTGSGQHYSLAGSLPDNGSKLTLHAFANNSLDEGVEIEFTHNEGTTEGVITVGGESVTLTGLSDISPTSFAIEIDVHNDETPAHVLIWATGTDFSEDAALFNSEEDGELGGNGSGTYWGISLSNSSLSKATGGEPEFEED